MALIVRAVVFLMVMAAFQVSYAAVHKVGNSAGWTIIGNVDYKKWAATKNFQVGDTIIFEYSAKFHNVMRVTHAMYKSCNASSPITTFTTGNDTIKITNYGHHFFLCGIPGHCQAGQKVDINVLRSVSAAAAPTPSSAMATPVPATNVPAPTPNNAASLIVVKGTVCLMSLAMTLLAVAVSTF
ncbi:mavicyanin-like [Abrus precatorius]|uniref:Mavicyanin-like n=1 Tax=Abrus precatorius TaxID=3816 RepID=A0A8B8M2P0_ABRPR|nr:mavicyanin-like [Abrus precatorius]